MLRAFLKSQPQKRICVVASPSEAALRMIRSIWAHGHEVFPVQPHRVRLLTHMIAESRSHAVATTMNSPSDTLEAVEMASRCMGVPVLRDVGREVLIAEENNRVGSLILEARVPETITPVTVELSSESFEQQIRTNQDLLKQFSFGLMPLSFNWVIDACTVADPVFIGSGTPTPRHVIVDPVTIDDLIQEQQQGKVDLKGLQTVILDWPFSDDVPVKKADIVGKLGQLGTAKILVRYSVPQLGPIAELVEISDNRELVPIRSGVSIHKPDDKNLHLEYGNEIGYTGRDITGPPRIHIPLHLEHERTCIGRKTKKREMRGEWKINKVPIAVYHKKRGFKGQIYYTTKHKGWTMYKSRY